MNIIKNVEYNNDIIVVYIELPPPGQAHKADILSAFVRELAYYRRDVLNKTIRFNGRMTIEMAVAIGIFAIRCGAKRVELYDPATDNYVEVAGPNSPIPLDIIIRPGMRVYVKNSRLFAPDVLVDVVNVGVYNANIRLNRETGWTSLENLEPVSWTNDAEPFYRS